MKHYEQKKIARLCLLTSFLFSFRACFNRLNTPPPPPNSSVMAYNSLESQQREVLKSIFNSLSNGEKEKLGKLIAQFSEDDLKAFNEMFAQLQTAQNDSTQFFKSTIRVLLRNNYNITRIRELIKEMRKGNLEDQDTQKFFSEVFKSMTEEPNNSTDSAYTPKYSTAEVDQQWEDMFKECRLEEEEKKALKTLLNSASFRDEKERLLMLLKQSGEYRRNFLKVLYRERKDEQKSLLEAILSLHRKNPTLAEKMIEKCEELGVSDMASIVCKVGVEHSIRLKSLKKKLIETWYEEHPLARTK